MDPEAQKQALAHWRAAFGLAALLVRDRSLAEDICQEAFLRLMSMRRPILDPQSLKPLLMRIVRNLAASEGRRRRPRSLESEFELSPPAADSQDVDPAHQAIARETRRSVSAALEDLDPLWRTVLYLRDGLDFSYAEIAAATERSADVVRVTLHRARQRIREALQRKEMRRKEA